MHNSSARLLLSGVASRERKTGPRQGPGILRSRSPASIVDSEAEGLNGRVAPNSELDDPLALAEAAGVEVENVSAAWSQRGIKAKVIIRVSSPGGHNAMARTVGYVEKSGGMHDDAGAR